jgi:hypothetical protein
MKKIAILSIALLSLAGPALAAKPPKNGNPNPNLSIKTSVNTVTFGRSVTITGSLKGAGAGTSIELQQNPYPYSGGFKATGKTTVTDAQGNYTFAGVMPQLNTQYRVEAKTSPPSQSGNALVQVRLRVSFKVSDSTPARGQMVRFSGTATPAHDGKQVLIQKKSSTGAYRTVSSTTLLDNGTASSKYSKRLKIRRSGTYRVVVVSGDQDHLNGTSRSRTLRVH